MAGGAVDGDERTAPLLPRSWPPSVLTGAAVVVGGGAPVAGALGGGASGATRWALLATSAVLAMLTVWFGAEERARGRERRRAAEEVAVEAEATLTVALNGAFAPITAYLGALAAARTLPERRLLAGQVTQAVVDAAVRLTAVGARSTFYRLSDDGQALSLVAFGGRSEAPRPRFAAGTADGDFVLGLVSRDEWVLVSDVAVHPLVTPTTDGYRSVAATAVVAGRQALGLLTVDAPGAGELTETDSELLRVLANLLASGLAQVAE